MNQAFGLCHLMAIYRQLVPSKLKEENPFTFECSNIFRRDHNTLLKKKMCYQSGPVECNAKLPAKFVLCDKALKHSQGKVCWGGDIRKIAWLEHNSIYWTSM